MGATASDNAPPTTMRTMRGAQNSDKDAVSIHVLFVSSSNISG